MRKAVECMFVVSLTLLSLELSLLPEVSSIST